MFTILKFFIITCLTWFFVLLIITILANVFGWNNYKMEPLKQDCHPVLVPLNNGYYYEYLCDGEDK